MPGDGQPDPPERPAGPAKSLTDAERTFTIAAPADPPKLADRRATVSFPVTNTTLHAVNGTLRVRPLRETPAEWLTLAGEPTRAFLPRSDTAVEVHVTVPPDAPQGQLAFRLDAATEANPDEDYTEGPPVVLEIPAPERPQPWWRRYWWIFAIAAAVIIAIVLVVVLTRGGDDTAKILKATIRSLETSPAAWSATMTKAEADLDAAGSKALGDVKAIRLDAAAQRATAGCGDDYVGRRLADKLRGLLHDLDPGEPAPKPVPVICRTDPVQSVDVETPTRVLFAGFDFAEFNRQAPFAVEVRYEDGAVAPSSIGAPGTPDASTVAVQVQRMSFGAVDRARRPELVLRWNSAPVKIEGPHAGKAGIPLVITERASDPLHVQFQVDAPVFGSICRKFNRRQDVPPGWTVDQTRGDPGHPGIRQTGVDDNTEALATLTDYTYRSDGDRSIVVSGGICAAFSRDAIFERDYEIFRIRR